MNEKEKVESADEVSKEENTPEPSEETPEKVTSKEEHVVEPPKEEPSEKADQKAEEEPKATKENTPPPAEEKPSEEPPVEIKEEKETEKTAEEPKVVEEKKVPAKKEGSPKDPPAKVKEDKKAEEPKEKPTKDKKKRSKGPAKKEEPPLKDPLEGFELLSRKEVVDLLVKKHSDLKKKYDSELKGLDIKPVEIVKEKDEEKDIRDTINDDVQILKGKRKEFKDKNKLLRSEFFDLLNREEKLKGHAKEVKMYSQFTKDLEWKLETEAITIETERRLLDELRETMDKMRSITDGYTPQEIHSRLNEIQEELGNNLIQIEECHRQILEKVGESNVHHDKFVDAKNQIRERESRRGWLKRRIELHVEMEKFWMTQIDQAVKLDADEGSRDLEKIKATLLGVFNNRDKNSDGSPGHKEKESKGGKKNKPSAKPDKKGKKEASKKPAPEKKDVKEAPKEPAPSEKKEKAEDKKDSTPPPEKKDAKEAPKEPAPSEKKEKVEDKKDPAPTLEKKEKETITSEPASDTDIKTENKPEKTPKSTEKKDGGDV